MEWKRKAKGLSESAMGAVMLAGVLSVAALASEGERRLSFRVASQCAFVEHHLNPLEVFMDMACSMTAGCKHTASSGLYQLIVFYWL